MSKPRISRAAMDVLERECVRMHGSSGAAYGKAARMAELPLLRRLRERGLRRIHAAEGGAYAFCAEVLARALDTLEVEADDDGELGGEVRDGE